MSRSDEGVNPEHFVKPHFPEGLRVLAVDDSIVCLKLIATLLHKCRYQVTTTTKATEALKMLRMNKENYDIVITDVKMLDMDGFELVEIIGLEMDIPVIMMSANDDTESVMKGVMHGARDYLVKPVRMEELKNIWQHVIRKTLLDPSKSNIMKEADQDSMQVKRQREKSVEKEDETNTQSDGESCAQKKQRIAWTAELHQKFVAVVHRLGVDKAVPKRILELMNEPRLTRENVASHLQKYRNMLRREKNKASTIQESNSNVNLIRRHEHVSDTTTVPSNNQGLHAINRVVGDHLGSNAEMMSFRDHHFPKTEMFGAPFANQRPPFLTPNPQEMSLQQNLLPPNIDDQLRPAMPIQAIPAMPIQAIRNVQPAPISVANPQPQHEYNGTKLPSVCPWRKVVDGYAEIPSHAPSFGAGQPGPSTMPLVGYAPYSSSPGAFNYAGTSLQMRGEAPSQMTPNSQTNSLVGPVRSSFPGQNDQGRNLVNFNGRGSLDLRGRTGSFQFSNCSPSTDDLTGNGQIRSVLAPPETSERESNGPHNSFSPTDDDLSVMVKEVRDL
ncbi:uncharacterized protein LOC132277994 [Cornus florida]|uniref:uncharacterized protein LOC132277994 n=1 Tax=Cornus florida TaxID=4283 RepID=UPI0028982BCB|nr:uncharacterized protein LOC132277994 [Cornus florida]